ncbi:Transcription initiation factor TFIID, subunit TAF12 (also component of histone acetyltransferase SAGA) [Phaffia rhodozyma]|uniref:Transcription initiation factor TFIID, subunit TAF12 (Also component of histone acetyltransferase SAGA) n=1 Tax=Phaffia rhodozyma TaxID=264483 RepID=A0A0F7SX55_PHARH|nr:Transcription initiation factor TFIID, subunit TAF12 (also component of histone acetyltransferase SAGA) [Phaffia rhodozyma]
MSSNITNQQQQQAQALRIIAAQQQQQLRLQGQNPNGTPKANTPAGASTGTGSAAATGGLTLPPGLANVNIGQLLNLARKGQLNPAQMEQFRALMAYAPQMQAQLSSQRASPAQPAASTSTSTPNAAASTLPSATSTPQTSQYAASTASPSPAPVRPVQSGTPTPVAPAGTTPATNSNSQQMAALALFRSLQGMSEEQRQKTFTTTPKLLSLWNHYTAQLARGTLTNAAGSSAGNTNSPTANNVNNNTATGSNTGAGAGTPTSGPSMVQGINSPALPNLQLPPGRARNPGLQPTTTGGPGMAGRPIQNQQVRPPLNGGGLPRQGTPSLPPHMQQQQQQQQSQSQHQSSQPPPSQQQQQQSQQQQHQQQGQGQVGNASNGSTPAVGNEPIPITRPSMGTHSNTLPTYKTTASPHPNPHGARPTLSTGLAAGPSLGTPSLVARSGSGWDEASRAGGMGGPKKDEVAGNGAGDWTKEGRKRKLREVVESVEKGEKLEDEVEDLILEMVDELIDSATHFAARLAKHRKSNVLEVKDLQLHFEMHHNIRVPGLASDEIRQAQSQATRRTNVLSQHANRVAAVNAARVASTIAAEKAEKAERAAAEKAEREKAEAAAAAAEVAAIATASASAGTVEVPQADVTSVGVEAGGSLQPLEEPA